MSSPTSDYFEVSKSIQERIITLSRRLRRNGVRVTTAEVIDAVAAASKIQMLSRREFYYSLRATLVKDSKNYALFDTLFSDVFSILEVKGEYQWPKELTDQNIENEVKSSATTQSFGEKIEEGRVASETELQTQSESESSEAESREKAFISIYSPTGVTGVLKEQDPSAVRRIRRIARKLERKIATRAGLRYSSTKLRRTIDLRRTMRLMVGKDVLLFRSRKYTRTKLLVIYDISGSMKQYLSFFVDIIYGLHSSIRNCEQFIFGTELVNITEVIKTRDYAGTCEAISNITRSLNGGTKIGACLKTLLTDYGKLLSPRVVTMIVSDGWDTGDIDLLTESLEIIKRKSSGILIWLNPLVDIPGYEPSCAGMNAAMPFVDVFSSPSIFKSGNILLQSFPYQITVTKR